VSHGPYFSIGFVANYKIMAEKPAQKRERHTKMMAADRQEKS
jgi:hypothetical protein